MSTDKTEQALRDALAKLIDVYDAMGCPRGPARILAEAALTAAPPAQQQSEPAVWRITTVGGRTFFEIGNPLQFYSQEWLDRCQEVTPLYAATPPSLQEPQEAGPNVRAEPPP